MIDKEKLREICGNGIYNNIPIDNIELIDISHHRGIEIRMGEELIASKGGATLVFLIIGGETFTGRAFCNHSDNYCRKTGRKLALVRAFRNYWSKVKEREGNRKVVQKG